MLFWRAPKSSVVTNGCVPPVTNSCAIVVARFSTDDAILGGGASDAAGSRGRRILFPRGQDENHYSVAVGLAWPRFQIDAAYDHSRSLKTASLSVIARY